MNRLQLTHPSELLFPLLVRGTAAGILVAAICVTALELPGPAGYATITFMYGLPFGALHGLLVAGGVYAVLAFRHHRSSAGVMQRLVPTATATAALLCIPAGILVALLIGAENAAYLLPAAALDASAAAVTASCTQSAIRAVEKKLNAGRPEPSPGRLARA